MPEYKTRILSKDKKFGMDSLGVNFWSRDFLWVLLKALGIFWGFDF